jgi:hypothetical protein
MATAVQLSLFCTPTSTAEKLRKTTPFSNPMRQRRRPYTTTDYRYLAQHYAQATGPELAAVLNRTLGSLKGFIRANPALRKRGVS